ncbi:MAG: N-acetylmuramoyl-L-alanine amidase [Bacteroidota bacterium]
MLKQFFEAIAQLFRSLFGGGGKKKEEPTVPTTTTTTTTTTPTTTTTSKPDPIVIQPIEPEDASEVKADDVLVSPETPPILIDPDLPDKDFDENVEEVEVPAEVLEPTVEVEEEEAPQTPETIQHEARFLWCLDNGHGSLQAGKRSPIFDDGTTQFFEYEFNRDIVRRIIIQLEARGVQYYNVVPEMEVGKFLAERVARANRKKSDLPKLYVSIHANAGPADSDEWVPDHIRGIETWHFHNSSKGKKIAAVFQRILVEKTGWKSRGLKSRASRQFYVLSATQMPSVLTENGFYNNKRQALDLMKDEVRQLIADAHVEAIMEIEENGI